MATSSASELTVRSGLAATVAPVPFLPWRRLTQTVVKPKAFPESCRDACLVQRARFHFLDTCCRKPPDCFLEKGESKFIRFNVLRGNDDQEQHFKQL
jgi:hypothetical protein